MKLYPPVKIKNNIENKYTGHYEFNIGWKEGRENDQFFVLEKKKRERENLSDYQSVMHSMRHGKNIARGLFYLILSLSACLMNDRH